MLKKSVLSLVIRALLCSATLASVAIAQDGAPTAGQAAVAQALAENWQVRRLKTLDLIRVMKDEKADKAQRDAALRAFDGVLTRFDKVPYGFTPMEAMDLYQLFYVPKDAGKIEANLLMLAWTATLGWYDALRFADESGRNEIINKEQFFNRALSSRSKEVVAFLEKEPQRAEAAVEAGINSARNMHAAMQSHYDIRWPQAYGDLARQCTVQGGKNCARPEELPAHKWPGAFEEAAAAVKGYYRFNKK